MSTVSRQRRATIGRRAVERGKETERMVAEYLRSWWPQARRRVETAWRTETHAHHDTGDIAGCPRLVWQVKSAPELTGVKLADALTETADQAVAAGADYGVLVHRRSGRADPGQWWAWVTAADLARLAGGEPAVTEDSQVPVRLELGHLIPLLLRHGYGQP